MTMPAVPPHQPPFAPPSPPRVDPTTNGTAIASVIVGPIALLNAAFVPVPFIGFIAVFVAFPLTVSAIILGHLGLRTAQRYSAGRVMAVLGLVFGYLALGVILATVTLFFSQFLFIRTPITG
ncbi:hypothetical protein [Microbacterium testaceum]|uniref:hypothetical protein n=1 Tax=Microbacterium testaceum TaxID=2033 RepID=UPI0012449F24|nr:hypothetical protein [Microbacterium testaceum]